MKTYFYKKIVLSFSTALLFYYSITYSQNIINPYTDYTSTQAVIEYPDPSINLPFQVYSLHPDDIDNLIGGWSGEYEISMKDHFWHRDADIRNNHAVSVIIESASFPFLPPCAANSNGCADDPNNS